MKKCSINAAFHIVTQGLLLRRGNGALQSKEIEKRDKELGDKE